MLFSSYGVLTTFYGVIFSLYAVLFLLCVVANSLYAVLFSLCTEVKSLYAVPFLARPFSRYTRCFFHYTQRTSFSLDLKRGQLRMEVKMQLVFLTQFSLGNLTELFHTNNDTPDMIPNQQGTGGYDKLAITIMLHARPGT